MKNFKLIIVGVLTVFVISNVNARDSVVEEKSIADITNAARSQFSGFLTDTQLQDKVIQLTENVNTEEIINTLSGLSGLDGVSSSLTNFLPDFQFASLLAEGDPFGGEDQVKVDFGYFLFDRREFENEDNNTKFVALVNRNSKVSKDIVTAFGEEVTSPFNDDIGSLDDIEFQFSYARNSKTLGRSLRKNRQLFTNLAREIHRQNSVQLEQEKQDQLLFELLDSPEFAGIDFPDGVDLNSISEYASRNDQKRRVEWLTKEIYKTDDSLRKLVTDQLMSSKLSQFGALVSNQPQVSFTLKYRSRDDLVGPNEVEFEFKYEFGLANLNRLRKKVCGSSSCGSVTLAAYQQVLKNDSEFVKRLESNDRFSFSLSYSDINDQDFSFAGNDFFKKGGSVLKASASYGRTLTQDVSRIDLGLSLEEYSDEAAGNDRILGSLTYTHRLSDRLSLPITLEFANKSEFLSDESTQFGGHIGLKWNFSQKVEN